VRLARIFALPAALGLLACARDSLLLRPGGGFRVVDDATGFPIAGAQVDLYTLHDGRDTVATWRLVTDESGSVTFPSVRVSREQELRVGRGRAGYECVASLRAGGFQDFSQRVLPGVRIVRLSRGFLLADAGLTLRRYSGR
jgi:5-hydroxyisourate hydrolase-like protein (transthyretin family)